MTDQKEHLNDDAQLPPTQNPRDGLIDFTSYSLQQLQELRHSIDSTAFPMNFSNLMAELERRERPSDAQPAGDANYAVRFTSRDGLRGWLQAKLKRMPVYGTGSIDVKPDEIIVAGWQRTWLGTPVQSELSIPIDSMRNAVIEQDWIAFESKRPFRLPKRFEFRTQSAEQAQDLISRLPATRTAKFEKRWNELREFNRRLNNIGHRAWLTPALIVANFAIFIAMAVLAGRVSYFDVQQLLNWGGNFGPLTVNGQWWRLFTALFLHLSLAHVVINMWVLWNVGRLTERLYGTWVFLFLYFASGVLGSLTSTAWEPGNVSVGASGAIFGILGAFLAVLTRSREELPAAIVKAYWKSTLIFVLFSLINSAWQPGIDNAAHVGGLLSGFMLGWVLVRQLGPGRGKRFTVRQGLAAAALTMVIAAAGLYQVTGIGSALTVPEKYSRSHRWYVDKETDNLRLWQELAARIQAGAIGMSEVREQFERNILPFWESALTRLEKERNAIPEDQHAFASLVEEFVRLRAQWARAVIEVSHDANADALRRLTELSTKTNRVNARLDRQNMRSGMDHRPRALSSSRWVRNIRNLFTRQKWTCLRAPPAIAVAVDARDSRDDGPAVRDAMGCIAQQMFMEGDYETLDSMLQSYATSIPDLPDGSSRYQGMVGGLEDLFEYASLDAKDVFGRTSDWRRSVKGSIQAELIEAMAFQEWAWTARGGGYAESVSQQSWAVFAYRVEMAAAALREIEGRASSSPLWYELSVNVGLDQSLNAKELRTIFDRGISRFPEYLPLSASMLRILMPRWLGSYDTVDEFIEEMSAGQTRHSASEVYARLYWTYASLEKDRINIFSTARADWNRMKSGFDEMRGHYPKSDLVLNAFARFACLSGDAGEYNAVRPLLDQHSSSTAWTDETTIKACDEKLGQK